MVRRRAAAGLTLVAAAVGAGVLVVSSGGREATVHERVAAAPVPPGYVGGRVVDADGQPVPNASVTVAGTPLFAGADGSFEVRLGAPRGTVEASAPGYVGARRTVDQGSRLDLSLWKLGATKAPGPEQRRPRDPVDLVRRARPPVERRSSTRGRSAACAASSARAGCSPGSAARTASRRIASSWAGSGYALQRRLMASPIVKRHDFALYLGFYSTSSANRSRAVRQLVRRLRLARPRAAGRAQPRRRRAADALRRRRDRPGAVRLEGRELELALPRQQPRRAGHARAGRAPRPPAGGDGPARAARRLVRRLRHPAARELGGARAAEGQQRHGRVRRRRAGRLLERDRRGARIPRDLPARRGVLQVAARPRRDAGTRPPATTRAPPTRCSRSACPTGPTPPTACRCRRSPGSTPGRPTTSARARPPRSTSSSQAFRRWGAGRTFGDYAYGSLQKFDYGPYDDAFKAATTPGDVDTTPPTLTPAPGGLSGTASDDSAVRVVRWRDQRGAEGTARLEPDTTSADGGAVRWVIAGAPRGHLWVRVEDIKGLATTAQVR